MTLDHPQARLPARGAHERARGPESASETAEGAGRGFPFHSPMNRAFKTSELMNKSFVQAHPSMDSHMHCATRSRSAKQRAASTGREVVGKAGVPRCAAVALLREDDSALDHAVARVLQLRVVAAHSGDHLAGPHLLLGVGAACAGAATASSAAVLAGTIWAHTANTGVPSVQCCPENGHECRT